VVAEDPAAGRIRANVDTVTASDGKSLYVTDLIFSNPGAEQGAVRLVRNGATLVALRLENFRDLDFHFVTPILFRPGDRMELRCPDCTAAALFYSGFER
jgi:hypothetical protein